MELTEEQLNQIRIESEMKGFNKGYDEGRKVAVHLQEKEKNNTPPRTEAEFVAELSKRLGIHLIID